MADLYAFAVVIAEIIIIANILNLIRRREMKNKNIKWIKAKDPSQYHLGGLYRIERIENGILCVDIFEITAKKNPDMVKLERLLTIRKVGMFGQDESIESQQSFLKAV